MTREDFAQHLHMASKASIGLVRPMVTNILPDSYLYLVCPNQSYDGNPLHENEVVFPDETLKPGEPPRPRDAAEVVEILWRDSLVPEWIDILVRRSTDEFTFFKLECCGRFTSDDNLLYYRNTGVMPFGVKGTVLPPHWDSVEKSGKFDLDWREKKR